VGVIECRTLSPTHNTTPATCQTPATMTGDMPRPPARKISISVFRRVWFCVALRAWVVHRLWISWLGSVDNFVYVCVHVRFDVLLNECVCC